MPAPRRSEYLSRRRRRRLIMGLFEEAKTMLEFILLR
jgi:hypothetical protein